MGCSIVSVSSRHASAFPMVGKPGLLMAKRGRPTGKIQSKRVQMRVTPAFLHSVDRWAKQQEDKPTRIAAIRRLVELGLKAKK